MTDLATEVKIREAAEELFTQKGYEATRVRDIAEKAGVNVALVNYYFKSKEDLFGIIMQEKMQKLFGVMEHILNDETTSLEFKIKELVTRYIALLTSDTNLPIFVFSELQKQSERFTQIIPADMLSKSIILRQINEKHPEINPIHFMMNILSISIFPYIMGPTLVNVGLLSDDELQKMIAERAELIPQWAMHMINGKILV